MSSRHYFSTDPAESVPPWRRVCSVCNRVPEHIYSDQDGWLLCYECRLSPEAKAHRLAEKWEWQRTHIPEPIRRGEIVGIQDGDMLRYYDENGFLRLWDGPVLHHVLFLDDEGVVRRWGNLVGKSRGTLVTPEAAPIVEADIRRKQVKS